jgi:hypothetical protein
MTTHCLADNVVGLDRPHNTDVEIVFVWSDNRLATRRRYPDGETAARSILADIANGSRLHVAEVYATREERHNYAVAMRIP